MRKIILSISLLMLAGCSHSYVFKNAAPITQLDDKKPSAVPKESDFNFNEYGVSSSVRYPMVRKMDPRRIPRSEDVNAADEVPASTWFTPRLGYETMSPEKLLKGPEQIGPPQPPFEIFKAKTKGNSPGFHVRDNRGKRYILKFDSGDFPAMESTANLIANRLFWGFGYNVPEDFLYLLNGEDLSIAEDASVTQDDVDQVLTFSAMEEDGSYRVTASLYVEGKILGAIPQRGTRENDPNDRIPHENLRILRALRVFNAFTGNSGFRSDNALDVYVGKEGAGHTVHYLLDFGETLGVHGVEKNRQWDGYEHFFSYQDSMRDFFAFGIPTRRWEKLEKDSTSPSGTFNGETFRLDEWRETTQFMPIRHSQPDDDYWAAKILAAVTEDHLQTLFQAANYPDPEYQKNVMDFLMTRRHQILKSTFHKVSPLESKGIQNGVLTVQDKAKEVFGAEAARYEVKIFNQGRKQIEKTFWVDSAEETFEIKIEPATLERAKNYLRIEIRKENSSRAAEFHVRSDSNGAPQVVGIIH